MQHKIKELRKVLNLKQVIIYKNILFLLYLFTI